MGEIDRWTNIHPDLLNEIAKQFYSYDDYILCRLVCKEWNFSLPKIPNNHKRNLWLALPSSDKTSYAHMSLEEKGIHHVVVPGMEDNHIRGSCYGWLICVMISSGILRMLNPFTRAHFDLPPISTMPHINPPNWPSIHRDGEYTVMILKDNETFRTKAIEEHKCAVSKVVVSCPPDNDNDNFMAVAIYGDCDRLAFYKLNDERWTDIETGLPAVSHFHDVMFFRERIYALNIHGEMYEFDAKTKPLPTRRISQALHLPHIDNKYLNASYNKYLIGCDDGSFFMLVRHIDDLPAIIEGENIPGWKIYHVSYKFDIFKLNKNGKEWSKIYNLGDHVFIIGQNHSTRVSSNALPNGKGNHIYYSDNQIDINPLDIAIRRDIGIFNLKDKSREELLTKMNFICAPTWLLY